VTVQAQAKVAVLGLGNVLVGDDALGPTAVAVLQATCELPPGVSALDAGTPGADLVPFIAGLDALVLIDTVRSAGSPGELRLYRREQLLATPASPRLSPHDPGLGPALMAAEMMGESPREVLLVGVIPQRVETGIGLSPAVKDSLPAVVAAVLAELERLGHPARRRAQPLTPDLWWEATRA
jgi:hydrogenase maturation protease